MFQPRETCPHCLIYKTEDASDLRRHVAASRRCREKAKALWARAVLPSQTALNHNLASESPSPVSDSEHEEDECITNAILDDERDGVEAEAGPLQRPLIDFSAQDFSEDDSMFYPMSVDHNSEPETLDSRPRTPPADDRHPLQEPTQTLPLIKHNKPTVEDVDEEEFAQGARYVREFPVPRKHVPAGLPLKAIHARTNFEQVHRRKHTTGEGRYAPFASEKEWELARWAVRNLGHGQINSLLELEHVSVGLCK
jgi:hypothetical protein